MRKLIVFFVLLLMGVALAGISSVGSMMADEKDRGNAQVIEMVQPSLEPTSDAGYAQNNLLNSEANLNNARADNETTLANSEAAQNYATIPMGFIALFALIGGYILSQMVIKKSLPKG